MTFREPDIIPIEIRPGVLVRVHGVPFDMTNAEARKIAAVIMALGSCGTAALSPNP